MFISYSHADKADKIALVKHLEPLRLLGLISQWNDQEIKAGERFDRIILEQLGVADIVLLLISIDFINSEYCYNKELTEALEREELGSARVIPILLRECVWQYTSFKGLQMVAEAKPIDQWPSRDAAFKAIVQDIKKAADDMLSRSQAR